MTPFYLNRTNSDLKAGIKYAHWGMAWLIVFSYDWLIKELNILNTKEWLHIFTHSSDSKSDLTDMKLLIN